MELHSKLICSYLGNEEYEGGDTWGDFLYLHMKNDVTTELITKLRTHNWYSNEYDPDEYTTMFIFKIDERSKEEIIKPFLLGKYSEISRKYVFDNFDFWLDGSKRPLNYKVLTKSPDLRRYWEDKLQVYLPPRAEVWSAPLKENEIYGYSGVKFWDKFNLKEDQKQILSTFAAETVVPQ